MTTVQDIPEIKVLEYRMTLGMTTMEGRGFYAPTDVGIAEDGRMYVANRSLENVTRGVRVTMCDIDSEYYGTFAAYGTSPGQFVWPSACNLDSRGRVYVSDEATHRISVFDREGALLSTWGEHGAGEGQLDTPSGLAFDADDNVYVADTYNHRVQKFTAEGRFLLAFGREGSGDGEFSLPWGITVGGDGCVYVADWGNDRVQKFAGDGEHLASFGTPGRGDGEFHRPSGVAVDANGYIYVADWGNERVQVLDPTAASCRSCGARRRCPRGRRTSWRSTWRRARPARAPTWSPRSSISWTTRTRSRRTSKSISGRPCRSSWTGTGTCT